MKLIIFSILKLIRISDKHKRKEKEKKRKKKNKLLVFFFFLFFKKISLGLRTVL